MNRKLDIKSMPLFYINQPNIKLPVPNMQDRYVFKNDGLEDINQEEKNKMIMSENHGLNEQTAIDSSQEDKKKPFNDLPLDEKIKHLKLVPASIAKVRYEFVTIERSYKGYFLEMKNGAIVIHSTSPRRKSVTIHLENLVDIKRIGL